MKKVIILISVLLSFHLHAACKCNCDPADRSICASNYDLDHPCVAICPGSTPGGPVMITACPVSKVVNPVTQSYIWISNCTY